MLNVKDIKYNSCSNGKGVRTVVFLSGCPGVVWNKKTKKYEHCSGCFNKEAWNFDGYEIDETDVLKSLFPDYIQGLSILGGEPLCKENQQLTAKIIQTVRGCYGNKKDIWIWTGYIYTKNPFNKNKIPHTEYTKYILDSIDVLIDGPFEKDLFDIDLKYRGSSNQRIIKM